MEDLRKFALRKWLHKFDENFVNHLSGDVGLEKITVFYKDIFYFSTKGQGGHWLNEFLKIDKLVPPPNYTSVADIPVDTPFRARVTIKSLKGKQFPKDAVSTMFPKNWSKERIREEVAWVYELAQKNKNLTISEPTLKTFGKIEGETTSGFKIIIEFDINNNIMNSYPKI